MLIFLTCKYNKYHNYFYVVVVVEVVVEAQYGSNSSKL